VNRLQGLFHSPRPAQGWANEQITTSITTYCDAFSPHSPVDCDQTTGHPDNVNNHQFEEAQNE
jgi:hypothetical protein